MDKSAASVRDYCSGASTAAGRRFFAANLNRCQRQQFIRNTNVNCVAQEIHMTQPNKQLDTSKNLPLSAHF